MFRLKCRGDENEREFPFGVRMQPDQARPLFWFWFADDEICDDFTLLFCIGRLRNVQSFKTHVLSCFSAN